MSLQDLIDRKSEIEAEIERVRRDAKATVITQILELMEQNGLTAADLVKPKKISAQKVEIKYRDNEGNTWAGRGLKPKWLVSKLAAGVPLEVYRVVR